MFIFDYTLIELIACVVIHYLYLCFYRETRIEMFLSDRLLTRGRLPISSFLCFIGGFSMGSWLTLFHQLQLERDLDQEDFSAHTHQPLLLLAILIISAPNNFDRRNTLRSTWLKLNPDYTKVKHFFVVGNEGLNPDVQQKLKREQTVAGDLLILPDLVDSYDNLTLKLSQGLSHLSIAYPFKYVLKCDDDSFARVDVITTQLLARKKDVGAGQEADTCLYWGFFDGRARVQKKGKWKEDDYELCDLYIPYALGGGYILSKKCTDFIVKNQAMLRPFRNEDVSVGTWLAPIINEKK